MWAGEFTVSNVRLADELGVSRQQLDRTRNLLIQKGLIRYRKGSGSRAGVYSMVSFQATQSVTQKLTQPVTQNATQPVTSPSKTKKINNKLSRTPARENANASFDLDLLEEELRREQSKQIEQSKQSRNH